MVLVKCFLKLLPAQSWEPGGQDRLKSSGLGSRGPAWFNLGEGVVARWTQTHRTVDYFLTQE